MPGILDQSSFRVQIWTHHLGDAGAESTWWRFWNLFEDSKGATMGQTVATYSWSSYPMVSGTGENDDNKNKRHQGTWHFWVWRKYCKMWQRMWYTHKTALGIISCTQSSTCFAWVDLTFHEHCQSTLQFWSGLASSIFAKACKGWKMIFKSTPWVPEWTESPSDSLFSLSLCASLSLSLSFSLLYRVN